MYCGGLPGPIRPQKSEYLAWFDRQIEVVQSANRTPTPERLVALADTRELEDYGQNTTVSLAVSCNASHRHVMTFALQSR